MGKLGQAIAKDLLKAQQDAANNPEPVEELTLSDAISNLFNEDSEEEYLAQEEEGELENEEDEFGEEYLDDEEDEEEEPDDFDLYLTIFEYPMALGMYLLNCEELLERYPELKQHRMFLMGELLEATPNNPESTVTYLYHNFWTFFDSLIADSHETLATIVRETAQNDDANDEAIELLDKGIASRMGLYLHQGFDDEGIRLEEIGTSKVFHVTSPSQYLGEEGEVWFARLLPPLDDPVRYAIMTTPYILKAEHQQACINFIQAVGSIDGKWNVDDLYTFMKYGPTPNYWLDYLKAVPSKVDHDTGVIYLEKPPVFPTE